MGGGGFWVGGGRDTSIGFKIPFFGETPPPPPASSSRINASRIGVELSPKSLCSAERDKAVPGASVSETIICRSCSKTRDAACCERSRNCQLVEASTFTIRLAGHAPAVAPRRWRRPKLAQSPDVDN